MSQPSTAPEYILEESKIIHRTKALDNFVTDLEGDIQVLYRELTKLEGFCGRIADDIRVLQLSLQGTV